MSAAVSGKKRRDRFFDRIIEIQQKSEQPGGLPF